MIHGGGGGGERVPETERKARMVRYRSCYVLDTQRVIRVPRGRQVRQVKHGRPGKRQRISTLFRALSKFSKNSCIIVRLP